MPGGDPAPRPCAYALLRIGVSPRQPEDVLAGGQKLSIGTANMRCKSRDKEKHLTIGAQAGESRIRDFVTPGGFTHFRRATQTPFNLVYEARP